MSTPERPPANPPSNRPVPADPVPGQGTLHAPWRMEYLEGLGESERAAASAGPSAAGAPGGEGAASFLRDYWLAPEHDERHHVIVRTAGSLGGMVLLNAFPYANGHLLVALGEGRARLLDYTSEQRAALWRLVDLATDLVETALQPQGVNIGLNQGRASGAGVPGHLHVHLVPRWSGDVNFMSTVARVRVIPASLEVMAKRYREAWQRLSAKW
ncbi:MAG: HIT family protein [Phycisphaerales bacterium]